MNNFNWWYVVIPFFAFFMAFAGAQKYFVRNGKICVCEEKAFERLKNILSLTFAVIGTVLIIAESIGGIIEMLLDGLTSEENPIWALIMTPFVLVGIFIAQCGLYYSIAQIAEWASHGYVFEAVKAAKTEKKKGNSAPTTSRIKKASRSRHAAAIKNEKAILQPLSYKDLGL